MLAKLDHVINCRQEPSWVPLGSCHCPAALMERAFVFCDNPVMTHSIWFYGINERTNAHFVYAFVPLSLRLLGD